MIKEIVVVHLLVRNQQFQILCSCATEAVVRQRKNLVVNMILHRKPVEFFFETGLMSSLLFVSVTVLAAVFCTS